VLPQNTKAEHKEKKTGLLSRAFNFVFDCWLFLMFYFMVFMIFVGMPLLFICLAVIAVPQLYSVVYTTYQSIVSIAGIGGFLAVVFGPVGLVIGLRGLWIYRGIHAKKGRLNSGTLRCFVGHHHYQFLDGYTTEDGGGYIYHTYISECTRCSSKTKETQNDISNYY
jgi:hypothetical protein